VLVVDGTLLASTNIADYPLVAPLVSYGWSIDSNCFPIPFPEIVGRFFLASSSKAGAGRLRTGGLAPDERCNSAKS
jgi:hypothetical protein